MRLLPRRRPRLPADAAAALEITSDEQVLAWSALAVAGYVAATPQGLRILTPHGGLVRRPWTTVDHLAWDADSQTLAVWWVGSRQATGLELPKGSFVPEVAHERWRASVLTTREVPLPGDGVAFVALRRAHDGTVTSQVNLPKGARGGDPQIRAVIDQTVAQVREDAGLDGVQPASHVQW